MKMNKMLCIIKENIENNFMTQNKREANIEAYSKYRLCPFSP